MIILDTCAVIYDALTPDRLTSVAREAIEHADAAGELACCDISLHLALTARALRVLPITPEIAALSVALGLHGDPADRIIAATAVHHDAGLVTSDLRLRHAPRLRTVW
jgi:PIN domain nuclease of toxin-antitoxin system